MSNNIEDFNNIIKQLDLIDIYRTFHPVKQNIHSFQVFRTFTKIDHIFLNKAGLNKFIRIKVIQRIVSDHSRVKLEIKNRKIPRESLSILRLNHILLHKP